MLFTTWYTLLLSTFAARAAADLVSNCTGLQLYSTASNPYDGVVLGECVDYSNHDENFPSSSKINETRCVWPRDTSSVLRVGYASDPATFPHYCFFCFPPIGGPIPIAGIPCFCRNAVEAWARTNLHDLNDITWKDGLGDEELECNIWPLTEG